MADKVNKANVGLANLNSLFVHYMLNKLGNALRDLTTFDHTNFSDSRTHKELTTLLLLQFFIDRTHTRSERLSGFPRCLLYHVRQIVDTDPIHHLGLCNERQRLKSTAVPVKTHKKGILREFSPQPDITSTTRHPHPPPTRLGSPPRCTNNSKA